MSSAWRRRQQPGLGRIRAAWSDSTPPVSRMTLVGSMLRRGLSHVQSCFDNSLVLYTVRHCLSSSDCSDPSMLPPPNQPHDQVKEGAHE